MCLTGVAADAGPFQVVVLQLAIPGLDVEDVRIRPRRPRPLRARAVRVHPAQLEIRFPRRRHRNSRHRDVRSQIIPARALTRAKVGELPPAERAEIEAARPQTRADCAGGLRPCPFVACVYHLYLDVNEDTGSIKINFPDIEVEELHPSCSLDVADAGGVTLETVGKLLNVTRERARQMYLEAKTNAAAAGLDQVRREMDQDFEEEDEDDAGTQDGPDSEGGNGDEGEHLERCDRDPAPVLEVHIGDARRDRGLHPHEPRAPRRRARAAAERVLRGAALG